jgi:hypothetical protein
MHIIWFSTQGSTLSDRLLRVTHFGILFNSGRMSLVAKVDISPDQVQFFPVKWLSPIDRFNISCTDVLAEDLE